MTEKRYQGHRFEHERVLPSTSVTHVRCDRVEFRNCNVGGFVKRAEEMVRISHVRGTACRARRCAAAQSIIEDCVVDGLRAEGAPLFIWNSVFRRVSVRGRVTGLAVRLGPKVDPYWVDALRDEYAKADDWAVDIRGAEFDDVSLEGVPGERILRGPDDAILERAQAAKLARKDSMDPELGEAVAAARALVAGPFDAIVLPAWRASKRAAERQGRLSRWADAGWVPLDVSDGREGGGG